MIDFKNLKTASINMRTNYKICNENQKNMIKIEKEELIENSLKFDFISNLDDSSSDNESSETVSLVSTSSVKKNVLSLKTKVMKSYKYDRTECENKSPSFNSKKIKLNSTNISNKICDFKITANTFENTEKIILSSCQNNNNPVIKPIMKNTNKGNNITKRITFNETVQINVVKKHKMKIIERRRSRIKKFYRKHLIEKSGEKPSNVSLDDYMKQMNDFFDPLSK